MKTGGIDCHSSKTSAAKPAATHSPSLMRWIQSFESCSAINQHVPYQGGNEKRSNISVLLKKEPVYCITVTTTGQIHRNQRLGRGKEADELYRGASHAENSEPTDAFR